MKHDSDLAGWTGKGPEVESEKKGHGLHLEPPGFSIPTDTSIFTRQGCQEFDLPTPETSCLEPSQHPAQPPTNTEVGPLLNCDYSSVKTLQARIRASRAKWVRG